MCLVADPTGRRRFAAPDVVETVATTAELSLGAERCLSGLLALAELELAADTLPFPATVGLAAAANFSAIGT